MKILLTGCDGQLGRCFLDRMPDTWEVLATDYKELDITSEEAVSAAFAEFRPDVVVNAAAYTAVDKAEEDIDAAHALNALGPKYLSENCAEFGAFMVHVSTDYVFDGTATEPYKETDPISPNSVYGNTKAEGETFVAESGADYVTLRTAWVFSEYGNNFVKTMLRLGETRTELGVVADQFGGPTYAGDLAAAIITILKKNTEGNVVEKGIYHYCGEPMTSWAGFAKEIFKQAEEAKRLPHKVMVNEITTAEYPTPATRPAYSMLDCGKIIEISQVESSKWKLNLSDIKVINKLIEHLNEDKSYKII